MSSNHSKTPTFTGRRVVGKWNKNQYQVLRELGAGANGHVLLVQASGNYYALKVSEQATELALEYDMLQAVSNSSHSEQMAPIVYELDDWEDQDTRYYFFVMEYVKGNTLAQFVLQKGSNWLPVLISQLLRSIQVLHEKGHAFGDLKTENCLVHPGTGAVRLIDFGGVTPFDKGIRQYTEWYDRAWWEQGSRRADVGYDLFAVAMIVVRLLLPQVHKKIESNMHLMQGSQLWIYLQKQIEIACKQNVQLSMWLPIIKKAWDGQYQSTHEMREDVIECMKISTNTSKTNQKPQPHHKRDWTDYWVWIMLAGSFTLFLFFYFYGP